MFATLHGQSPGPALESEKRHDPGIREPARRWNLKVDHWRYPWTDSDNPAPIRPGGGLERAGNETAGRYRWSWRGQLGNVPLYRDEHHVSPYGVKKLEPILSRAIEPLLDKISWATLPKLGRLVLSGCVGGSTGMNLEWAERFRKTKLYDLLMAAPLIAVFGRGLWNDVNPVAIHIRRINEHTEDLLGVLQLIAMAGSGLFCALLIVMLIVRTTPRARAYGALPRILAVAGTFLGTLMLYLPPVPLSLPLQAIADVLIIAASVLAIVVLSWLGRSFAIMAEARELVTTGPYAIVRHPLYVVESLGMLAMLMQFASLAALAITITQLSVQVLRSIFEERVLSETFPEYEAYRRRTARFIPGVI